DVDGSIQNPEQPGGHPQRRRTWHQDEGQGTQSCAGQKVGTTAAEAPPGMVAGVADNRLYDQPRKGRGEPEDGNLVGTSAQVFIDGAHVGHLQSPAKLNAEESEAHVPDLPE